MEDAEKMAALKKAYADIILNQSKEAATRIMVTERKALQFQQELSALKHESLNMLVRLKQMMDSKVAEAETASLSQRSRIEELEAQLHEAKDIERNLKAELKKAHIELAKVNSVKSVNEQMEEGTSTSELPLVDSRLGPISPDTTNALSNQRTTSDHYCFARENSTEQTVQLRDSPENYDDNTGLASILMKSKNPELYKNGCTQRIRAFERNLMNGNMSNLAQADHPFSSIKDEQITKEGGATEGTCTVAALKDTNLGSNKKNPSDLEDLLSCQKVRAFKFLRRSSRKRSSRYRKTEAVSCAHHDTKSREQPSISSCKTHPCLNYKVLESRKPSSISRCKTYASLNNKIGDSREGFTKSIEQEEVKTSESHLISVTSLNLTKLDESLLNGVAESSGVPDYVNPNEVHPSSMGADSKDDKKCKIAKTDDDKPLKYTFMRKRKRETFSSPEKCESLEQKNTAKKMPGEKQSSDPEPQKSNLLVGSSRDSRRLAQVARQLISLSEKNW